MKSTISSKGQITVPMHLRRVLGLTAGTRMVFEAGPHGTLVARKASNESFFAKFQGVGKTPPGLGRKSSDALDVLRGPVEKGDVD